MRRPRAKRTSRTPNQTGNTVNIGRSIKLVRTIAELKQGEMAERLGITQNYLSLLENNKAEPSLSLLRRISDEFNVPINFLLLESSVEFESSDPEEDLLFKRLHEMILKLQSERIKEKEEAGHESQG